MYFGTMFQNLFYDFIIRFLTYKQNIQTKTALYYITSLINITELVEGSHIGMAEAQQG